MVELQWYKNIHDDLKSAQEGKCIVLHAGRRVCRVMSFEDGLLAIRGYASADAYGHLWTDQSAFLFNNRTYLESPSCKYVCCEIDEAKEGMNNWYRSFCEEDDDSIFDTFLDMRAKVEGDGVAILPIDEVCIFRVCTVHEGKALAVQTYRVPMEHGEDGWKVTQLPLDQMVEDFEKSMKQFGTPPSRPVIRCMVTAIICDFADRLEGKGVILSQDIFRKAR